MAIARMVLTKIEGKIFEDAKTDGNLSVSTNSRIDKVEVQEINKQKVVVVEWGLDTDYTPKIGKIFVEGKMFLTGEVEKMTTKSGKELTLHPEQAKEVHQTVLRMPLIASINLARELGLPLPIRFPTIELSDEGKKKGAA